MSIHQVLEFLQNHWLLASAFVIVLIVIVIEEVRSKGMGATYLDPQQTVHAINRENALVLDVRDVNAFKNGHMIGAINIPAAEIDQQMSKLNNHKERTIIIVCATGQKGQAVLMKLKAAGFSKLSILKGGLNAWKSADMPVVTGKGAKING